MQSDNAKDEDERQYQDDDGVDLETGRFIRVEPCRKRGVKTAVQRCQVYQGEAVLSMVLLEPPAPAALVLVGRALAIFSFWSAAARRRIAVLAPPGGVGEEGRPPLTPLADAAAFEGESDRGEDWDSFRLAHHGQRESCFSDARALVESDEQLE